MRISVKAKPRAKQEKVEQLTQPSLGLTGEKLEMIVYKVSVQEPPEGGAANEAIARALAKHFDIAPSRVHLLSGHMSKQKVFEVV